MVRPRCQTLETHCTVALSTPSLGVCCSKQHRRIDRPKPLCPRVIFSCRTSSPLSHSSCFPQHSPRRLYGDDHATRLHGLLDAIRVVLAGMRAQTRKEICPFSTSQTTNATNTGWERICQRRSRYRIFNVLEESSRFINEDLRHKIAATFYTISETVNECK